MKNNSIFFSFITVFLFALNFNVQADVNVKNFEFKGRKFGEKKPSSEDVPAWDVRSKFILKESSQPIYTRIDSVNESNQESLNLGGYNLSGIKYSYFDNALYLINVSFQKQNDCVHAREVNELIQLKYGFKSEVSTQTKFNDYLSRFDNGKVRVSIDCSKPILDVVSNTETTEKQTEIVFEDLVASKRSHDYRKQVDDDSFKKSQKLKEDKLRQKINF